MLDRLFGPNIDNLQSALDRTSQRQAKLMSNVANVNVPGYKRQDLDFNIVLKQQLDKNPAAKYMQEAHDRLDQQRSDQTSIRVDGNNVDMEKEVMSVADTELHYNALTDLTQQYFGNLKNVIREGK